MKEIGELHNEGVAKVMNEIHSLPTTRAKAEFDVLTSVNEFISEKFSDMPSNELNMIKDHIARGLNAKTRSAIDVPDITEGQKPFLEQLDIIMSDGDSDLESLRKRIVDLEADALLKLSENELTEFFAGTAVAYYTLGYWQDYVEGDALTRAGFSWKELGKADVCGAVAGATEEGVRFLIAGGPFGWKAFVAVVVGSAVAGSVADAIYQLW